MTATRRVAGWDGLRGLAVAAVLGYHLGWEPLRGGFLGVSAFFTLSGFLITSLLAAELAATGTLRLGAFWARRVRRLVPAILAATALVVAFGHLAATAEQQVRLRGDTLAALTNWANWRFLFTGQDYGGAIAFPSPLLHTWSLSIEEQCYFLLPVLIVVGYRLAQWRGVWVATGTVTAFSIGAGLLTSDPQAAYYGTHVRAAELLIGAIGALAVRTPARMVIGRACVTAFPLALAGMVWSWTQAEETSAALRQGGFVAHAVATLVVVIAVRERTPLARTLRLRPLVWLGSLSYGVYLYHWPIFLWVTPRRLDAGPEVTSAVRLALTLSVAALSMRYVERPVLRRRDRPPFTLALGGMALAVTAAVASVVVPVPAPGAAITLAGEFIAPPPLPPPSPVVAAAIASPPTSLVVEVGRPAPETRVDPPLQFTPGRFADPPRILVVGDSVASTIGSGLQRVGVSTSSAAVYVAGWVGCPITLGGEVRWNGGVEVPVTAKCSWAQRETDLDLVEPDLVVISSGLWEVADRRLDPDAGWTHIGDPAMNALVRDAFEQYTELFRAGGVRVVWLLQPPVRNSIYAGVPGPLPEEDPHRMAQLNAIIRVVAAGNDNVWTVDLPALLADRYKDSYALESRPDGMHWNDASADRDAAWLLPLLVQIAAADSPTASTALASAPRG